MECPQASTEPSRPNMLSTPLSKEKPKGNFPRNVRPWSETFKHTEGKRVRADGTMKGRERAVESTDMATSDANVILGKRQEEHEIFKFDQGGLGKSPKSSITEKYNHHFKKSKGRLNQA